MDEEKKDIQEIVKEAKESVEPKERKVEINITCAKILMKAMAENRIQPKSSEVTLWAMLGQDIHSQLK